MARRKIFLPGDTPDAHDPSALAFAKRLNGMLLARGWRASDLTRECQKYLPPGKAFGRHLVNSWLHAKYTPSQLNMEILVKALRCKIADLVPENVGTILTPHDKTLQMSMASNGQARVKLDMEMPADIALQIMTLVNKVQSTS